MPSSPACPCHPALPLPFLSPMQLAAGVHQQQLTGLELLVVASVVREERIGARRNDRRVRHALGAQRLAVVLCRQGSGARQEQGQRQRPGSRRGQGGGGRGDTAAHFISAIVCLCPIARGPCALRTKKRPADLTTQLFALPRRTCPLRPTHQNTQLLCSPSSTAPVPNPPNVHPADFALLSFSDVSCPPLTKTHPADFPRPPFAHRPSRPTHQSAPPVGAR